MVASIQESAAQLRQLDREACVLCDTIRSHLCNRCSHCRRDAPTRDIVGDTFQDRRQPGHAAPVGSLTAHHPPPRHLEGLEGAISGQHSSAVCRYRCRLLFAEVPKGSDRNVELKLRLQLWEAGEINELVGRVLGQQHSGALRRRKTSSAATLLKSAGNELVP